MQPVYGERERERLKAALRREAFWAMTKDIALMAMSLAALIVACAALGSK